MKVAQSCRGFFFFFSLSLSGTANHHNAPLTGSRELEGLSLVETSGSHRPGSSVEQATVLESICHTALTESLLTLQGPSWIKTTKDHTQLSWTETCEVVLVACCHLYLSLMTHESVFPLVIIYSFIHLSGSLYSKLLSYVSFSDVFLQRKIYIQSFIHVLNWQNHINKVWGRKHTMDQVRCGSYLPSFSMWVAHYLAGDGSLLPFHYLVSSRFMVTSPPDL